MPELPEVDAVVRRLHESLNQARIAEVHIERPGNVAPQDPDSFHSLRGATVLRARRRAKYIFLDLSGDRFLQVHLRMTGNLYILPDWRFRPHTARVWFRLKDQRALIFDDPRTLGRVHIVTAKDIAQLESSLGPEPLESSFTPATLEKILASTRTAIKPAIMDQRLIAGIGNIYASEALWHARIHPQLPANQVPRRKVPALHSAIQKVLRHAVASAYAEYTQPGTFPDSESFGVAVYGRAMEPCERCQRPIERIIQSSRSTFFCPKCQK
jgi:formamidopyrimidine-DNA glycosylase